MANIKRHIYASLLRSLPYSNTALATGQSDLNFIGYINFASRTLLCWRHVVYAIAVTCATAYVESYALSLSNYRLRNKTLTNSLSGFVIKTNGNKFQCSLGNIAELVMYTANETVHVLLASVVVAGIGGRVT